MPWPSSLKSYISEMQTIRCSGIRRTAAEQRRPLLWIDKTQYSSLSGNLMEKSGLDSCLTALSEAGIGPLFPVKRHYYWLFNYMLTDPVETTEIKPVTKAKSIQIYRVPLPQK